MNKLKQLWAIVLIALISLLQPAQAGYKVSLKSIDSQLLPSGQVELRFHFNGDAPKPSVFIWKEPTRTVFDFNNAMLSMPLRHKSINKGNVEKLVVREANNKLRVIAHQTKLSNYSTEIKGYVLVIRFDKSSPEILPAATSQQSTTANIQASKQRSNNVVVPEIKTPIWDDVKATEKAAAKPKQHKPVQHQYVAPKAAKVTKAAPTQKKPSSPQYKARNNSGSTSHNLRKIDFRRNSDGSGRVDLILPSHQTEVEELRTGTTIRLLIKNVDVPEHLQKRLNVLDFATPVNYIETSQRKGGTKILIYAKGNITYKSARDGNKYSLTIKERKAEPILKKKKKVFKGEKLSLNFQDIEVRAVLQLLADFTDKNIVVSDTVDGSVTLRLKDVPWDQALDIVLETKGLAIRENGSVIWVAPAEELAAKEQKELEAIKRKGDLEPLVTEYIAINFAKAQDLAKLIRQSTGDESHSLLSRRGTVSLDDRTNTLLVQDVSSQVEEIRSLIEALDVPVQQVLIESRIVVATDEFTKDLGAKFGATPVRAFSNGVIAGSGTATATSGIIDSAVSNLSTGGSALPVSVPSLGDRLSVNLPAAGAAGSFGFSILAKDFLLDLELSALQAESKGEVIATPRVITSNQSTATIEQGVEIPYQEASSSGATSVSFKKAVLSLDVTPQITPDEHVVVDLKVHQDTVGQVFGNIPSINTRTVQTKVLVENAQTIVLGGVHEETNLQSTTKVPILGDLPVVGRLFKKTQNLDNKRELLIFVTPKIIDSF